MIYFSELFHNPSNIPEGFSIEEDLLEGFSIIEMEELVSSLKEDPDFRNDIYESIITAEVLSYPYTTRACESCASVCCETDCPVFQKGIEYQKRVDPTWEICYRCPEYTVHCLGYEHCIHRNIPVARVKDIIFLPRSLYKEGVISQEELNTLDSEGIEYIDADNFETLSTILSEDTLQALSDYAHQKIAELFFPSTTTTSTAVNESMQNVHIYAESPSTSVHVTVTREGNFFGYIEIEGKTVKFLVKGNYITVQERLSKNQLSLIEQRIKEITGIERYNLPKKVYE